MNDDSGVFHRVSRRCIGPAPPPAVKGRSAPPTLSFVPQDAHAQVDPAHDAPHEGSAHRGQGAHDAPHPEVRKAPALGIAASLIIHALFLLLAAFILLDRPGGDGAGGDAIELAIVTDAELTQLQNSALEESLPEIDAEAPSELLDATVFDAAIPEVNVASNVSNMAGLEGAGSSLGEGMDLGGGAGSGSASFFGVEARGSRFAYIVDVSGSMTGAKIETLKRELIGSIESLNEHASFCVVLYSHEPRIIGGRRQWERAIRRAKDFAQRDIGVISAGGATNPLPAFEIVFDLRPRPDAIYFMTDGQFPEVVAHEVARMNDAWIEPTPVHTISFVSREAEEQLRRIAESSQGTYTHIEGPTR